MKQKREFRLEAQVWGPRKERVMHPQRSSTREAFSGAQVGKLWVEFLLFAVFQK